MNESIKKITAPLVVKSKGKEKIISLTSYDAQTAAILEKAGVDIILVGDSLGNVIQGQNTTLNVRLNDIIYHTRCVASSIKRAMLVADMPFGTYNIDERETLHNALRCIQEGFAHAVKVEGGERTKRTIERLVSMEIPVMAHIGLTPQSYHKMGGYKKQKEEDFLLKEAKAVEEAGAFSVVLECIEKNIAKKITDSISIPTIGIGSGERENTCDGSIYVINDIIGFFDTSYVPAFAPVYANVGNIILKACEDYIKDVNKNV